MKTWLIIIGSILFLVVFILIISYLSSVLILKAASKFMDELNNDYANKIVKLLPNTNCKECGYDDCDDYAASLLHRACVKTCPYMSLKDNEKINELVDKFDKEIEELKEKDKQKADQKIWKRKEY